VDPQEEKDVEMEFQDARRALKSVYGHSGSESSDNEHRKALHVMFRGGGPCHVQRFLGHHVYAHHQNPALGDCSRSPSTKSSTAPQVGGNSDWVQHLRLP
jgi:hypothetical protein